MAQYDESFMRLALKLAHKGLGLVAPNPSVGCVLVQEPENNTRLAHVVGTGFTGHGGLPHAEEQALKQAGEKALGATAYITLEPCCHVGRKSISCVQALIEAGIKRVVASIEDPNEHVNGKGFMLLRKAGIHVDIGLLEKEAHALNEGFFLAMRYKRPLVTLKMASSLDGGVAAVGPSRQWLAGRLALAYVHALRQTHEAIMVGIGTALKDNPRLTCRLPGKKEHAGIRLVVDERLDMPLDAQLVQTARSFPLWIITSTRANPVKKKMLVQAGAHCLEVEEEHSLLPIPVFLRLLAQKGITRLLLEGGPTLAASFLQAGCVDRISWIVTPFFLGCDSLRAMAHLPLSPVEQMKKFKLEKATPIGEDVLLEYTVPKE